MSIVDISVKRPVTIWMFTFAVLLFGFVSLSKLSINLLPELSYPTLTIRTNYTGAAPGEVEQLVSKPIEEAIGVVKGVRRVESTSKAGQSDVLLEFEWGTEMDMASLEVREKLDILQLPLDVERPVLLRFNPNLDPIIRFGLGQTAEDGGAKAMDMAQLKALRTYAEQQLKIKLESVSGVASVQIGGGLENEIQVLFDQQRIGQLDISANDIVTRLRAENINSAGGRVEDGNQEYLVRTLNQFESLDEMRDLFIATRNGRHIRLGDIADVHDAHKERTSVTRFEGLEGIEIAIYKEGDANTVEVAENVGKRLQAINKDLPAGYKIQLVYDQSTFIANAISEVKSAGIVGGLLAMLVLYLFLRNIWPTLIISISIPVSIIATFNLMYGNDISLNIMSLGGIALAIGLLVDNSIVVLENIDRLKKRGVSIQTAASEGTKEVSTAIVASTLTTIAVFFPLVFVEGIAGQLFRDQALTVTFALAASLVVALTIIPMLAAREIGQRKNAEPDAPVDLGSRFTLDKNVQRGFFGKLFYYLRRFINAIFWAIGQVFKYVFMAVSFVVVTIAALISKAFGLVFKPFAALFNKIYDALEGVYQGALKRAMQARTLVFGAIVGISALSVTLLPQLGMELIPSMAQGEFYVEVTLPSGARLENTDEVLSELAGFTQTLPQVARTYSLAGTGSLMNASPGQGGDFWGRLNVVLKPEHKDQTTAVIEKMRGFLRNQAGINAKFGEPALFSFATPLEIEIVGYDLNSLRRYGDQMVSLLEQNDRFADVKSNLQAGHPELRIHFDHARLAQLGLDAPSVSKLIATKVGGEVASKFSLDDRKVDILVRADEAQRDSSSDIGNMIVNPGGFPAVPLSAVADIQASVGPSEISRIGQQRVVVVSANLAYGDLGEAAIEADALVKRLNLPASMSARVGGQNEEMESSFNSLLFALGLAIFLVYIVMASQFESLLHPFLILFTVPLACAGSIYGLFLTGANISVIVFIGLIMLAGIVVNNAIVLIDRINQLREQGMDKAEAIFQAASSRLRPILMTTLTTTLGLLPMAMGVGEGAEIRAPMAITVIFGLMFATLLTLFLIPVLYSLFDRKAFAVEGAYEQA
ncbi:efflux RND transporter permease subunit [Bowmanella sp. JS7-9]|uniref:Efflux RND transporter permease subunit n=1 Tax=Pseudobowmanella zhangzhouensis TaxID=1537679 RepID=A0ABW1XJ24_9ALTE|nr:efflux RND transporter permease subunit [Bowmanella sp. JS7-9]TBX23059.1 acriflavin resistance protein [Bowmanella sp. JS7-9]